jgi:hypothetical protein
MVAPRSPSRPPAGTYVVGLEIAVAAVGLLVVAFGPWRVGVGMIGAGLVAGSFARTLLPERRAGLLRVRRPSVDVAITTALGILIVALAFLVPDQPPRL